MRTAGELLAISKPEKLFPNDPAEAKKCYHDLAKEWHPDAHKHNNKESENVFQHISVLYERALQKFEEGGWDADGVLLVHSKSGTGWMLKYLVHHKFALGDCYVGDNSIVYLLEAKHKSLVDNALRTVQSFKFHDAMEKEFKRYLPQDVVAMETKDGKWAVKVGKTPDLIMLRDVVDYYKGCLDEKHIAWVQSSLHNLACYLSFTGISHQDISLDTYFISPKNHNGALLGGWWYSAPIGSSLIGKSIPTRTFSILPWEVQQKRLAMPHTDLELVRAVGRECGSVPNPMRDFLRSASSGSAVDDYKAWGDVLKTSFGARRFTEMKVSPEMIYQE